ncbi:antimicrobial ginkbilobin-2-like protein [Apium graveolens]|uniref:antimicrobial ginkbilobin-2-like protein n=1 Tax=Apium graveolens TaxID=4045 RepID=UPI003D7A1A61
MPSSNKISICLISLLTFTIFLQTPFAFAANPLSYYCINPQNFTAGTPYELNLNQLTGLLDYLTQPSGYAQASISQQVYGLGLCRGDVSSFDCLTCISEAGIEARKLCPGNKGAVIWYDNCMFKYLDQNFFGQIDKSVVVSLLNVNNITNNQDLFKQRNSELLGNLSQEASISSKRYARGEIAIDENTTIYGLAQCTRDLSSYDCKKCLDDQIYNNLPQEKIGGRVLGGSCNVRYEVYPFLKL